MHIFKGFDFQTLWKKSPLNRNSYTLLSQNNRPKLHEIFHVNEMRFEVIHFAIPAGAVTSVQITHDFDADAHF